MITLQHVCLAPILAAIFSVVVATPCEPRVFIPWSDYNDKKPTTGIHVQSMVSSRMMCLRACFVANHTRSVFYSASTLTCYCANEPPSSLNLEDEAGTKCIQPMGTVETWMTSVIGVSSEFGINDPRFLATQMLGPPDVYPNYGDLTGTWCANSYDDRQWIEANTVEIQHRHTQLELFSAGQLWHDIIIKDFEGERGEGRRTWIYSQLAISEPMFVDQVYIYETYHAGGLQNLSVRDTANSWHLVWTTPNITVIRHSRIFAPDFQSPSFQVTGFSLHVDMTLANWWVQLDAMLAVGRN